MIRGLSLATTMLTLSGVALAEGNVWIVDASGGGQFLTVQEAIDAAGQRDTVLIRSGTYAGFLVHDKSLQIVEEEGGVVRLTGTTRVQNLSYQRDVHLLGLEGMFELASNNGQVLMERCGSFLPPTLGCCGSPVAYDAVVIESCSDVVIVNCQLRGGDAHQYTSPGPGYEGGDAVRAFSSALSIYGSSLRGGDGSDAVAGLACGFLGGDGGDGLVVSGCWVFHRACGFFGGAPGLEGCYMPPASPGQPIVNLGSTVTAATTPTSTLTAATNLPDEGSTLPLTYTGAPGHFAVLVTSHAPYFRPLPPNVGVLHLRTPLTFTVLGVVPGGGVLQADLPVGSLPPGAQSMRLYLQVVVSDAPYRYLSNPLGLVVLDPSL